MSAVPDPLTGLGWSDGYTAMPKHDDQLDELVAANRILANEGIVDGFGHVSMRHPDRPDCFYISQVKAPELVTRLDVIELDLDCRTTTNLTAKIFAESVIHSSVYRLRSDVNAVCHHHAPAMLPFCVAGVDLFPVIHLGATMGPKVPFWDSQDEFGDTNLLIATQQQGMSMARALGPHWTLLLRRHGATVAGRSVRELVFRTIYGARNAEVQLRAMQLGSVAPLPIGEARAAEEFNLTSIAVDRNWDRWCARALSR